LLGVFFFPPSPTVLCVFAVGDLEWCGIVGVTAVLVLCCIVVVSPVRAVPSNFFPSPPFLFAVFALPSAPVHHAEVNAAGGVVLGCLGLRAYHFALLSRGGCTGPTGKTQEAVQAREACLAASWLG
jgi:hypothetical protein